MTRKEAIDILKNTIVQFGRTNGKTAYAEALYMAIKALEQPEIIQCKDCKYWREYKCAKETKRYIHFVDSMLSMQNQMIFALIMQKLRR